MTYPTVKCPVCRKLVMLTPKGRLPNHQAGAFRCSGSGVSYPKLKEQQERRGPKTMTYEELIRVIEEHNLCIRRIPTQVVSVYEIRHFKEGDEVIERWGRQMCRRVSVPAHAGHYMVQSVNRPLAAEDLKDVITAARLLTEEGIRGYDDETIKFVDRFLEYQSLSKIYGSFIVALLDRSVNDGRIYPDLKQTGTVSGRFASANPNGQNLPTGKKCKIAGLNLDIRAVFRPDPSCVFVTLDESALEVRVLAHFCGEPALIEALHLPKNQGGDPHQAAADKVYAETAIKIARDAAKTIQFGLIYGMSEHGLSLKLGISKKKALELIAAYYRGMPCVAIWKQALEHQIRRTGEVRSLLGRIRKTELHRSNNKSLIEAVVRSMTNTQIQGSAADIINSAMVKTHNNERYQRTGARICLQVHDELVSNCPRATAEEALNIKSFYMRNPFNFRLKVPLCVEGGISEHWEH